VYGIGGSVSDGSFGIAVYGYPQRMVALSSNGENAFKDVNGICDRKIYPFAVPEGATKMTVTCPGYRCSIMSLNYENDAYTQVASTGWQELDEGTCSFTKAAITHVIVNFANSDWSNIPADTDTSGFSIQFD